MKKLLIALTAALCVLSFAACGDSKPAADDETPAATATPAEDTAKEEAPAKSKEEMQVIGNDTVGYVSVPADWKDITQGDLMQYADPKMKYVITMNSVSRNGMTDEQKAMATVDFFVKNVTDSLEDGGTTNIKVVPAAINGMNCQKLTGDYGNGKVACWFVEVGDEIYFPSVEGPEKDMATMIGYVENSFSTEKSE